MTTFIAIPLSGKVHQVNVGQIRSFVVSEDLRKINLIVETGIGGSAGHAFHGLKEVALEGDEASKVIAKLQPFADFELPGKV